MKQRQRTNSAGFTLIELMAVVVVLVILIGLIIGGTGYAQRKAAIQQAHAEIAAMEQAMEDFKGIYGFYPNPTGNGNGTTNSTQDLCKALRGSSSFVLTNPLNNTTIPYSGVANPIPYITFKPGQIDADGMIIDPFGEPYRYRVPGTNNPASFDLWSGGPDRKSDTNTTMSVNKIDDVTNWGRN